MELQKQVPSLELCKELKAVGFPQEDIVWYWYFEKLIEREALTMQDSEDWDDDDEHFAAPTVAELGWELHSPIKHKRKLYFPISYQFGTGTVAEWQCELIPQDLYKTQDGSLHAELGLTEADARAKMWLYLKSNNLL